MMHSMFMSKPASSVVPPKDEWAEVNAALASFKAWVDSLPKAPALHVANCYGG